jgi:hypothetical protein
MGLGIGTLVKLEGSGIGPDEILEMLASMGIDMDVQQVESAARQQALLPDAGPAAPVPRQNSIRGQIVTVVRQNSIRPNALCLLKFSFRRF